MFDLSSYHNLWRPAVYEPIAKYTELNDRAGEARTSLQLHTGIATLMHDLVLTSLVAMQIGYSSR